MWFSNGSIPTCHQSHLIWCKQSCAGIKTLPTGDISQRDSVELLVRILFDHEMGSRDLGTGKLLPPWGDFRWPDYADCPKTRHSTSAWPSFQSGRAATRERKQCMWDNSWFPSGFIFKTMLCVLQHIDPMLIRETDEWNLLAYFALAYININYNNDTWS